MWKDHKTLNRINENISGWGSLSGKPFKHVPYYVRHNPHVAPEKSIEYTTEIQPKVSYPDEIFMTSAGRIDLYDEGEFGGHLEIGGKLVCQGNFSKIFEFKGGKYVIDDLRHIASNRFRLIKVNDNGTIEVVYNAGGMERDGQDVDYTVASDAIYGMRDMEYSIGLDAFYIGKDFCGNEKAFFLCSGSIWNYKEEGNERYTEIQYLLMFDPDNESDPFIRINLPCDKVEIGAAISIWSDGIMLAVGCMNEVVMVYLPEMDVEYWTQLDTDEVERILEEKRKYRR